MSTFKKVAVIGAGTMGAGIAGQVANAGVEVLLLDLPSDGDDVNAVARKGLDRISDPEQPGLIDDTVAERIELGNIRDDLHRVSECDWIAEAVVERLNIKHDLYRDLAEHMQDDAILTSNTSTIPIKLLTEGMTDDLKQRFAITHFFNPVRFMRLLELVSGEETNPEIMKRFEDFSEEKLGKGVVNCSDTPGFLANRVGCYAIQFALHEAFNRGIKPQIADALFGRPMGIPKTGVFGLYDLIGIDLMSDVAKSLESILPENDAFHAVAQPIPLMTQMIANGQTGNKGGKGFYLQPEKGGKQVLDFDTNEYVDFDRPNIDIALQAEQQGVKCLIDDDSEYGQYAWSVLSNTLVYAASLIPEVGNDPAAIDDAMKLGYNWISGPFELIDEIGVDYLVKRLQDEGREVPAFLSQAQSDSAESSFYRVKGDKYQRRFWQNDSTDTTADTWHTIDHGEGVNRFMETRNTLTPVNSNDSASWFDYEDVALVEFHTKANALDGDSMSILSDALDNVKAKNLKGLIVHNDAQHFSCGVNLEKVREYFNEEDYQGLDEFLNHFQQTVHKMAVADFPVVVATPGMSIGGGFEVVLHAQHVIAHSNSVMGLVESMVGVIPSGGGCKELLYRWMDKLNLTPDNIDEAAWKTFMTIGYGRTASSPVIAKELAMLRDSDTFLMNRDRLLSSALDYIHSGAKAEYYERPALSMPGKEVYQAMAEWLDKGHAKGMFTPHDTVVGRAVASIVTGGEDVVAGTVWSEQDLYDAERRAFLKLAKTEATQARINSMLDLGQTLRN
ncbi:3-hydroxyacyl-CoA dehydrogenase/enoyl-CoA hydratase family protein [uncultured Cocleimonas sp.]|uniref:3-hydroxyacyl-CoA dehydrogenase/enoyl-CoA hydratase family protein n=1 Tax=uncultured Cocleimonas sp. TaxID=1051587 RepID=UPI00260FBDC3|nr:3-hydroxyacyl-CoA dehydrogenase/enoyl-CoA hydratase family protein [uncultured Cocleimonas sp.]